MPTSPDPKGDSEWAQAVITSSSFPAIATEDPYLAPYTGVFKSRFTKFQRWLDEITSNHQSLVTFAQGYTHYGFNKTPTGQIVYREYAPKALDAHLIGDFNQWNRSSHPMSKDQFGVWSIMLPANSIPHGSKIKIAFTTTDAQIDRISPWARYVVQDPQVSVTYESLYWDPPKVYEFKHARPSVPQQLKIYEAHVGIASEDPCIGTYREFCTTLVPKIARLGYNAIQLMAVQEHAYYASFGYQVTSFFAPSSRFGTPDDLKHLIDQAHAHGLVVLLDLVHSHASNNVNDGLNMFDGTDHCYFHGGPHGTHTLWDSRLFNYGHYETLRFLLSNVHYWSSEFRFDGFRFDGVTSMLYTHHGIGTGFSGHYDEYFGVGAVDDDAVVYLMLANYLIHHHLVGVTVAEDVSGMPGLCRPIDQGGVGFDFRLGMAVPDMWIKLLKEVRDEDWDLALIVHTLTNRRWNESTIGYAESHDQALVGDKTLAFWLMDKDMYNHMSIIVDPNPPPTIDRGIALHKMIRLVTLALAGEGYLTFMGNEFGHPEWLDFPRAGNNNSYHYARRQWSLATDPNLRYQYLQKFDTAMLQVCTTEMQLLGPHCTGRQFVTLKQESDKVLAFERWDDKWHALFVFNWHPSQSYTEYRIGTECPGEYSVVLDSDDRLFGGHARVDLKVKYVAKVGDGWNDRKSSILAYLPSRTALVFVTSRQ